MEIIRRVTNIFTMIAQAALRALLWSILLYALFRVLRYVAYGSLPSIPINWNLGLKYAQTLEWPTVAIIALVLLRGKLPGIIDRTRELSGFWGKVKLDPPAQPDPSDIKLGSVAEPDALIEEGTIVNAQNVHDDEAVRAENKHLREIIEFDRIIQNIYGTQLDALKSLSDYGSGQRQADLSVYLNRHKRLASKRGASYEDVSAFMKFLVGLGLVNYDPESEIYKITTKGRAFLEYVHNIDYKINIKDY